MFLAGAPVRIELRGGRVALTTLVAVPWLCCGPTLGSGVVLRRRLLSIVMGRGLLSVVIGRGIAVSLLYVFLLHGFNKVRSSLHPPPVFYDINSAAGTHVGMISV